MEEGSVLVKFDQILSFFLRVSFKAIYSLLITVSVQGNVVPAKTIHACTMLVHLNASIVHWAKHYSM